MSFDGDELRRLFPRRQPSRQPIHNVNRVKSFGVKRKSAFRPPFLATRNAEARGSDVSGLYFEPCSKYCVVFGSWRWRCPRWRSRVRQPRRRSYRPEPSLPASPAPRSRTRATHSICPLAIVRTRSGPSSTRSIQTRAEKFPSS